MRNLDIIMIPREKNLFVEQRDSAKTQSKSGKRVGKEQMSLFSNYNPVPKRQIRCDVNCNYLGMNIIDFRLMTLNVHVNVNFKFNSRFLWDGTLVFINNIENCRRQQESHWLLLVTYLNFWHMSISFNKWYVCVFTRQTKKDFLRKRKVSWKLCCRKAN